MIRENILIGSDRFFNIRSFQSKYFTMPRHLHAEYELVWIDRGFGKKSIGEVIKPFTDGDLTLIGPDCPHLFIADDAYYADNALRCHWRVIQFSRSIFPTAMTELELFKPIHTLLESSEYGLDFGSRSEESIRPWYDSIETARGFGKLTRFYELLAFLAGDPSSFRLNRDKPTTPHETSDDVVTRVYNYLLHNFNRRITLAAIARSVNMHPTTLCSYYKKYTLKSIFDSLMEIRIGHACRLLVNTDLSVAQVAYESGYENISNFNRQFLRLKKVQPKAYKKLYKGLDLGGRDISEEMSL